MKQIDITTPQNVVINYTLATLMDRVIAFSIDLAIVLIFCTILYNTVREIFYIDSNILMAITFSIPLLLYNLCLEIITNGQSLGKKLLKIKVVKLNGDKVSSFDFMMRWVFRLVEILLSLGTIAAIMISSTRKSQRIGDMLSDLVVIKTKIDFQYSTNWLANRKDLNEYTPSYPEVKRLSEQDMLTIKETIVRYTNHRNQGHTEALDLLAQKIEELLQIKVPEKNRVEFMNQLIRDYVFMSR